MFRYFGTYWDWWLWWCFRTTLCCCCWCGWWCLGNLLWYGGWCCSMSVSRHGGEWDDLDLTCLGVHPGEPGSVCTGVPQGCSMGTQFNVSCCVGVRGRDGPWLDWGYSSGRPGFEGGCPLPGPWKEGLQCPLSISWLEWCLGVQGWCSWLCSGEWCLDCSPEWLQLVPRNVPVKEWDLKVKVLIITSWSARRCPGKKPNFKNRFWKNFFSFFCSLHIPSGIHGFPQKKSAHLVHQFGQL